MAGIKGQRSGGRSRKPRALHLVEGTFKTSRHAGQDVAAPAGCPEAPRELAGAALDEWQLLTGLLASQGTLSLVDGAMLASHCRLAALVSRMEAEVAALPSLTFDKVSVDGAGEHREPKAHPLVSQLRAGRMALRTSLQEFGLTPASRTRVTPAAVPVVNPLDKYINRKRR